MRTIRSIIILGALLWVGGLQADAVRNPATIVRQWEVSTSTTAGIVNFTSSTGVGGTSRAQWSCHVKVIHDGGVGSPDVYLSLSNTAADLVAPTNGADVFTLKAGESLGFDGEFKRLRHLAASGTPAIRVIVTLNEN